MVRNQKHLYEFGVKWVTLLALLAAAAPLRAAEIMLTLIDDRAIAYATFTSHNQKVVATPHGIYLTYLKTANDDYTAQRWRLMRSTDAGRSFDLVHEGVHSTNPPMLERGDDTTVYMSVSDWMTEHRALLYRFDAARPDAEPQTSVIPMGGSGKNVMRYDPERRQLYHMSQTERLCILDSEGKVQSMRRVLDRGQDAYLMYPHLALGDNGTLYMAWTTQLRGEYLYHDIRIMRSHDGGASWHIFAGKPLAEPIIDDRTGPTDRITREDEFDVHSWLSAFLAHRGKLHLVYWTKNDPQRQRYMRIDAQTLSVEIDREPLIDGREQSEPCDSSLLVADAGTLYCVTTIEDRKRLICLVSDDLGATWREHAVSDKRFDNRIYTVGGCRDVTADGHIIGTFTHVAEGAESYYEPESGQVYFFSIPTNSGISQP